MVALSGPSSSTCLGGFPLPAPGNGPVYKASGEQGHSVPSSAVSLRMRSEEESDEFTDCPILRTKAKYKMTCTPDSPDLKFCSKGIINLDSCEKALLTTSLFLKLYLAHADFALT